MQNTQTLPQYNHPNHRKPLQPGTRLKIKHQRGEYKITRITQHPNGTIEALCWWRSGPKGDRAQWRTIALTGPNQHTITKILTQPKH